MRKLNLFFVIALLYGVTANAKVWRVNNNPGVVADFATAQEANNSALVLDGDTIHLEPSATYYAGLNTNKRLVWISTGYFLTENPGNQFSITPGTINGAININTGSAGSVFSIVEYGANISINTSSITLIRCKIYGGIDIPFPNAVVQQCYIGGAINITSTNAVISNNIVVAYVRVSTNISTAVITNNVLYNNNSFDMYNCVFQNNISQGNGILNFINSSVSYNMSSSSNLPAGNNNQLNVNMTNVFVNPNGTVDKDFQLKVGSPAIGAGDGGVDMGAFGGSNPFVLALQPTIPAITNMTVPSSSGGNTIQIIFSAKSNN